MAEPELFPASPKPDEHVKKNQGKESEHTAVNTQINSIATRLKVLEERYQTMRRKGQVAEQNIIETEKEQYQEFHLLNDEVMDLKHKMKDLTEQVTMLKDEIAGFAPKSEIVFIKKYLEFWNPVDFVTRKEVNDFLRKKFREEKYQ